MTESRSIGDHEQRKASAEALDSTALITIASHEALEIIQISPPRTPSRASSHKPTTVTPSFARAASPFQNHVKTSISPSQSIANLSQKGLASERRRYWEASTGENSTLIAPLRLSRQSSTTPTSKTPIRGPSVLRNFQESGERELSAASSSATELTKTHHSISASKSVSSDRDVSSASTVRQKGAENVNPSDPFKAPPSPNNDPNSSNGKLSARRLHRKPAPTSTSGPCIQLVRSPSQTSVVQSSVTVAHAQADLEMPQSQTYMDWMRKPFLDKSMASPLQSQSQDSRSTEEASLAKHETEWDIYPQTGTKKHADSTLAQERKNGEPYYSPSQVNATTVHSGVRQTPSFPASTESALFVRNPDSTRDSAIHQKPIRPEEDDNSYFNYATGMPIPAPGESATFPLAKTYSDWHAPSMLGAQGPVIPTSPDLSGQSRRTVADKVYSKSPLSKSPGKNFMGKMVGAAKKAVHTGIKSRTGNGGRSTHNEEPTSVMRARPRINLDDASSISLVPTAIQLQEQQDLQNQWGNEGYLRHEANPNGQFAVSDEFSSNSRERDLPVSDESLALDLESDVLS